MRGKREVTEGVRRMWGVCSGPDGNVNNAAAAEGSEHLQVYNEDDESDATAAPATAPASGPNGSAPPESRCGNDYRAHCFSRPRHPLYGAPLLSPSVSSWSSQLRACRAPFP